MEAFTLAKEQFKIGERLGLQPGLQAYVALHCVEAASLVLSSSSNSKLPVSLSTSLSISEVKEVKKEGLQFATKAKDQGAIGKKLHP